MKALNIIVAAAALLIAAPSMADDVLVKNKCNTCHDATAKKVGPTWKEVAAAASADDIKAAIEKGAKGKYGTKKVPMPPQPNAKADADAIVKAIMAMK